MAKVVSALEEFAAAASERFTRPSAVRRIDAQCRADPRGQSVNIVPDYCEIEIDRRVIPGEDPLGVMDELRDYLRTKVDFEFEMLPPWIVGLPLGDDENGDLADRLLKVIGAQVGPRKKVGVPYRTHASRFAAAGVPSVVFGPGSIRQAHTKDEWLPSPELRQATDILEAFLTQ